MVAIRNTDINIFFKYFFHLRSFGLNILKNASKIIFLTPKYFEFTFQNYFPKNLQSDFVKKTNVVPNGVNPYWLDNSFKRKSFSKDDKITFLYVGDFSKNKNVHISIQVLNTIYSLHHYTNLMGSHSSPNITFKQNKSLFTKNNPVQKSTNPFD